MPKYSGKPTLVPVAQDVIFSRLTNLSELQNRMHALPDDLKQRMGTVNFPDPETLAFTAPGVGEMKFRVADATAPSQVKFVCETGFMPIHVVVDINADGADASNVAASIEADIPLMVRPLVGPKLQEAADKFGEMFGSLNA